jgi:hypothetical protein
MVERSVRTGDAHREVLGMRRCAEIRCASA